MNCMSFTAAGEQFAVDVTQVMKVVRGILVTPVAAAPHTVTGLANLKGSIVTILNLSALLQSGEPGQNQANAQEKHINAVIFKPLSPGDDLMGLQIDAPGDLIEADIKGMQELSNTADSTENFCISGTVKSCGNLYRMIDLQAIIEKFKGGTEENDRV